MFIEKIERFKYLCCSVCVSQKHICDGQKDCPNGEDEKNCPIPRKCEMKSKCEQLCITSADGQDSCACKIGYIMHDNKFKYVFLFLWNNVRM